MLFTTTTCPNCRAAKTFLDNAGIEYTVVNAEEHPELCEEFGIAQAPTLVVTDGPDYTAYAGLANVRKYAESAKVNA